MDSIINVRFHHGGKVTETGFPKYEGELGVQQRGIDLDHFSLVELNCYSREIGYFIVKGFYYQDTKTKQFKLLENDSELLGLVLNLKHEDFLDIFIKHAVDDAFVVENVVPIGFVETDLNDSDGEALDFGEALEDIPGEDDSDVDEELRGFREKQRQEKREEPKKNKTVAQEIELGEVGIDRGFEDFQQRKENRYIGKLAGDEEYIDSSDVGSDDSRDELDSQAEKGVDLPVRRRSKKVRYDSNCKVAIFELGMIFDSAIEFRKAVADYAIQNKAQLKLKPNEKQRVRARCTNENCKWELYASEDKENKNFMVRTYYPAHKCLEKTKNKLCTTKFIARKLKQKIISQPDIRVHKIQEHIKKKWGIYVGRSLCYRAKMSVIRDFLGDWKLEFSRLADYADMIKQTNPGSSCWIRTDNETMPGKNLFMYFYVCFDAMKKGWLHGCRRIIGFDGCFLKGFCKGELLVAIGKNGNQQMFPIAWAVVDKETKHSWSWFINYLISDLELGQGDGLTVMSDRQKGLIPTIKDLLPNCEQRMCARHIWSNWAQDWRGEERRKQFWRCAKASFPVKLKDELAALGKLGEGICEDLLSLDKEHWCKAYFRYESKCDVVENNMCETFNSWIVGPRHKSIISMLEEIRHKIMSRNVDMRKFPDTWILDIAPMARVVLEGNKDLARRCEVLFNGDVGYEIRDGECRHIVNLPNRSCTCRLWMLKGIPCPHAICAFYHSGEEAEDYVEHWYRKDTFLEAYKCCLQPMPNMKMWPDTNNPIIDPPEVKPMPGRPKRDRRREKTEPRKKYGKATKIGVKMTCSTCKQTGHNKKGCKTRNQSGVSRDTGQSSTSSAQHNGTQASATTPIVPMASNPSSICEDTFRVQKSQSKSGASGGRGRGRGSGRGRGGGIPTSASGLGVGGGRGRSGVGANSSATTTSTSAATSSRYDFGATRPRVQGYGIYTDIRTGTSILNQGMPSERVLTPGLLKNAADTNIDLGFRPHALKRKGKKAITTSQIQHHRNIVASARKKLKNFASSNDIE